MLNIGFTRIDAVFLSSNPAFILSCSNGFLRAVEVFMLSVSSVLYIYKPYVCGTELQTKSEHTKLITSSKQKSLQPWFKGTESSSGPAVY